MDRRNFLAASLAAGATAATGSVAQAETAPKVKKLVVGISCSPRKGKTTSKAVQIALEAAQKVNDDIITEMVDLGDMNISGWQGGATPGQAKEIVDDFTVEVKPYIDGPDLAGLIIGSPVYFRSMSSLCKAFLERLASLRTPKLLLADVAVGALSVGAYRNGGQELVIEQIQAAMLCHEVVIVGGKPRAHQGATLWNAYKDDIEKDEFGVQTAQQLGIRVAEAALKIQEW